MTPSDKPGFLTRHKRLLVGLSIAFPVSVPALYGLLHLSFILYPPPNSIPDQGTMLMYFFIFVGWTAIATLGTIVCLLGLLIGRLSRKNTR